MTINITEEFNCQLMTKTDFLKKQNKISLTATIDSMVKVKTKLSRCFRSKEDAQKYLTTMSYIGSAY